MTDHILVTHGRRHRHCHLQPAKMRNAISLAMWSEIARSRRAAATRSLRHRLRGAATRPCSGADTRFTEHRRTPRPRSGTARRPRRLHRHPPRPKPTWPWCSGSVMGGQDIAMACDLRFAAVGSRFGIPAAKRPSSTARRRAPAGGPGGPAYAKDILYSARTVDAEEALRIGFIQRLLPVAELERYTDDYRRRSPPTRPVRARHEGAGARHLRRTHRGSPGRARRLASRRSRARTTGKAPGLPREAAAEVPGA